MRSCVDPARSWTPAGAFQDVSATLDAMRAELRRAWPYALVLALVLGAAVVVGANLSNAFPSKDHPFGWAGPANFENAVAMVRPEIVLACTLPALAMGATALRRRDPREQGPASLLPALGVDAALLVAAALLAAIIGFVGAAKTTSDALVAFASAQALLALAFFALGYLAGALVPRHALPAALAVWSFFNLLYEGMTRVALFRQMGYDRLSAGEFPAWFWVSQALSPLAAYRGVLILWRRGFMDYLEKAALGNAALPAWMTPATFALLMLALWVALPLGLALGAWWLRGRLERAVGASPASRSQVEG
jgi:hypothetical protein